jgi:hypothetical protein
MYLHLPSDARYISGAGALGGFSRIPKIPGENVQNTLELTAAHTAIAEHFGSMHVDLHSESDCVALYYDRTSDERWFDANILLYYSVLGYYKCNFVQNS